MCKGGNKAKKKKGEKAEAKTDEEKDSKEAARIAAFKRKLEARSPPTVYMPDESSERALAKIPEIGSSTSGKLKL